MGNLKNIWVLAIPFADPQYFPSEELASQHAAAINTLRSATGKQPHAYSVMTALQYKLLMDNHNEHG
jgi:hypothetical protein